MKTVFSFIKKRMSFILLIIQFMVSVVFSICIYLLDILPILYYVLLNGILIVLFILSIYLMKHKKNQKKDSIKNRLGKIVSILMSIVLMVGSIYIVKSEDLLNSISDSTTQTNTISVIVLKKSSYQELEDVVDCVFGYNSSVGTDALTVTLDAIIEEIGMIESVDYEDFDLMAQSLYDGDCEVVVMDEAYRVILENEYESFDSDTRVIWQYNYETALENFAKNVEVTEQAFIVYISGIDTTGSVSTLSRSDVNMVVAINPTTKQILMLSIPRDYYVDMGDIGYDKITHAGLYGIQTSVETVENLLDIEVNYYAKVNFTSLVNIVDALGGITVYASQDADLMHGGSVTEGYNEMDGELALSFARERYSYIDGDNQRVKNQQEVLKALIDKATSAAILTNYSDVLSAIYDSMETNMSTSEITSIIKMQLRDGAEWEIQTCQLSGSETYMYGGALMPSYYLYYTLPDQDSIDECVGYINNVLNGEDYTVE